MHQSGQIIATSHDLTPKGSGLEGFLLISGKSRLVKYYNLARSIKVSLPLTTFSALNFKVMTKGVMARHTGEMVPSQWTGALGTTVSWLGIGVSSNGGFPPFHTPK